LNRLNVLARTVAGSFLALIAAYSLAPAGPQATDKDKAMTDEQLAEAAYDRLKGEIDSFTRQWRRGIDDLSRTTSQAELGSRTVTLFNKLVHFAGSACMTRNDGLRIRDYLKDSAERQGIVTEAPRSTSVVTFKIDSALVGCENHHLTGGIALYDVRFVTVTRH
jgi:hypothetical protein